ncbi:UDP-N-acetylmuramoyl-tripeptide--D-alanyl-D-alanine ligase [Salinibacterium sp. SWN248]|uniref:UDP-N-acetylmuramoyl-tripeptide--D-alanyl-D- alanine ligase n=1 Tax=Salinibacterium sp. SWN248 TaxID=2792056 RepID=UPI0018CF80C8|nr:UDP-N-acetylmuramoyl-tripeptide--D-alanyl-D-alanine ligase [Salinibacterium sp. SWN248]MBH0024289.1 UDP-N-acetylmuramoyl-tripeptide--D-alanyl-D-alanine ligase [Salinibacterium sp. SWN248]
MIELSIAEIATAVGGELRDGSDGQQRLPASSVQTDSRLSTAGSVFFALRGESTDGHLFAATAVANGATLVVAERPLDLDVPQIIVADGVTALQALARTVVASVRSKGDLKVVAVTGSNGKTTTKNMLRAILEHVGETVAPQGSFNNDVGAPITMLNVADSTQFLVVEMGADGLGDITRLQSIVTPDVGIVLMVGLAHIGKFGDAAVTAQAKSEMVSHLPSSATAVLNNDDGRVKAMAQQTEAKVTLFGLDSSAEVWADDIQATVHGTAFELHVGGATIPVQLRILGEHHVTNALAAISAARALGIDPARAVAALESIERAERWRMELLEAPGGITVINDAYNASPDSMAAALKTLVQIVGPENRSVAVLGELAELGDYANDEHDRIGRLIVRLNVQKLIVVGHEARHIHNAAGLEGSWDGESVLVDSVEEAYAVLREELREGDVVLVKSSNSAGLRHLGDRIAGVTA